MRVNENLEIFLFTDQPTTCPRCGARTRIESLSIDISLIQERHKCPDPLCRYEFLVEDDSNNIFNTIN
jgi:transposase-like protein